MEPNPVQPWLRADIDQMLALLPVFESPDFVPCTWTSPAPGEDLFLPYPTYHPAVDQLHQLAFGTSAQIDPYGNLPEDAENPPPTKGPLLAFVESASMNQIRRYLTHMFRAERFCDGYVESQFTSGCVCAALRRVESLRAR